MELEILLIPYLEEAIEETLQNIIPLLNSEELEDKENVKMFFSMIQELKSEISSIDSTLKPEINAKIDDIIAQLSITDEVGDKE
jgi:effector-binding domain-containing protein